MKFRNKERANKIIEKISLLLYELEDLNDYRQNKLNKIIDEFNKIKVV